MVLWFVVSVVSCPLVLFLVSYISSLRRTYSIKGKHVLITGGSSGIGKSIARDALRRGAGIVTLVARNKEKLFTVKQELESKYRILQTQSVSMISADISSPDIQTRITEALVGMKPVDVLINCAGITYTGPFLETSNDIFESIIRTNIFGAVYVTRAILQSMIDRKDGRIVFVSSQAGQFPLYGYTAYSSSKFALKGFTEVLQMEVKPHNIKVIVSYPPDTDTPQLEEEVKHRSPLVKELAAYSTTLKPEQIAHEILDGVERGQFTVNHGFDGFMLKTLSAGAAPISSVWELITQFFLGGIFRVVALGYLAQFNNIVARNLKKTN